MKTSTLTRQLAHIACLPWVLIFLMFLLASLIPPIEDLCFAPIIIIHNMFMHEWYGRIALAVSGSILAAAFTGKPRGRVVLPVFVGYTIVLLLIAGYTVWWGVSGQQYDWP